MFVLTASARREKRGYAEEKINGGLEITKPRGGGESLGKDSCADR